MPNVKYKSEKHVGYIKCPTCLKLRAVSNDKYYDLLYNKTCHSCLRVIKAKEDYPLGTIYGSWTIIESPQKDKRGSLIVTVRCACGEIKQVVCWTLKNKSSRSCSKCGYINSFKGYKELSHTYFEALKTAALRRKISFNITIEQIWGLFLKQERKCAISGISLVLTNSNHFSKQTASVDRIDSSKPYIFSNVQWVHKDINKMKMDLPQDRFIELCKLIAQNN